jgi:hypothetical protein
MQQHYREDKVEDWLESQVEKTDVADGPDTVKLPFVTAFTPLSTDAAISGCSGFSCPTDLVAKMPFPGCPVDGW